MRFSKSILLYGNSISYNYILHGISREHDEHTVSYYSHLSRAITGHHCKQLIMEDTIPKVDVNATLSVLCMIPVVSTEHLQWRIKF